MHKWQQWMYRKKQAMLGLATIITVYIYICDFIVINNCIVIYVCNVTHTHIHGHLQHVLHMIDTVLGSLLKIMVNIVYWMLLMVEY